MKTINELTVAGKVCLVRCDLNVPLAPLTYDIIEKQRLVTLLPTIKLLRERGAKVVLMSHLGRPKSAADTEYSMEPVRRALSEMLGTDIIAAKGPISDYTTSVIQKMQAGEVAMLENLRFLDGESENSDAVSRQLADLGDVYINDAFAVAHRRHASVVGVPRYLPSALGPLFQHEVDTIGAALGSPREPSVAIMGGAKVSDKFPLLRNIAQSYSRIIVGGGVAAVFLALRGYPTGGFDISEAEKDLAKQLVNEFGDKLEIPTDFVVVSEFREDAPSRTVNLSQLAAGDIIMDIGSATAERYAGIIASARTVIWNGPVGFYEWEQYQVGSNAVGRAVARLSDATTIAGGGSTVSIIKNLKLSEAEITHVSTGGGAFLKMLAGEQLPGYEALKEGVQN